MCYGGRRHWFIFRMFKERLLPLKSDYWTQSWVMNLPTCFLSPLWSSLTGFHKAVYSNILSSNSIMQVLLPFQEVSLMVYVSMFRARMVSYQLQEDPDSSHRVKFIFLVPDGLHAHQNLSGLFVVVVSCP